MATTASAVDFFSSFDSTLTELSAMAATTEDDGTAVKRRRAAPAAGEPMVEVRGNRGGGVLISSPLRFRERDGVATATATAAAAAGAATAAAAATGTAAARGARAGVPGITVVGARLLSSGVGMGAAGVGKRKEIRSMRGCC